MYFLRFAYERKGIFTLSAFFSVGGARSWENVTLKEENEPDIGLGTMKTTRHLIRDRLLSCANMAQKKSLSIVCVRLG